MSICFENQAKLHRWVVWYLARKLAKQLRLQKYVIGGSYRRGSWWCNDIDLLVPVASEEEAEGIRRRVRQLGWLPRSPIPPPDSVFGHQLYMPCGDQSIVLDIFFVHPGAMVRVEP